MTMEQIKTLTEDEVRIRVHNLIHPKDQTTLESERVVSWKTRDGGDYYAPISAIPNYPQDLNACHEMEEVLTDIQFCKYVQILCGHTTRGVKIGWTGPDAGRACHAAARHRCEAFIRTVEEVTGGRV